MEKSKCVEFMKKVLQTEDPLNQSMLVPRVISFFGELVLKGDHGLDLIESYQILGIIKRLFKLEDREILVHFINIHFSSL